MTFTYDRNSIYDDLKVSQVNEVLLMLLLFEPEMNGAILRRRQINFHLNFLVGNQEYSTYHCYLRGVKIRFSKNCFGYHSSNRVTYQNYRSWRGSLFGFWIRVHLKNFFHCKSSKRGLIIKNTSINSWKFFSKINRKIVEMDGFGILSIIIVIV